MEEVFPDEIVLVSQDERARNVVFLLDTALFWRSMAQRFTYKRDLYDETANRFEARANSELRRLTLLDREVRIQIEQRCELLHNYHLHPEKKKY